MIAFSSFLSSKRTLTIISPFIVNLIALFIRFISIRCKRAGSQSKISGIVLSYFFTNAIFFSCVFISNRLNIAAMDADNLNGISCKINFPASTYARSSMSLINTIKESPDILIACIYFFCFHLYIVRKCILAYPIFVWLRLCYNNLRILL